MEPESHTQKENDNLTSENDVKQDDENTVTTYPEDNTCNSASDNHQVNEDVETHMAEDVVPVNTKKKKSAKKGKKKVDKKKEALKPKKTPTKWVSSYTKAKKIENKNEATRTRVL